MTYKLFFVLLSTTESEDIGGKLSGTNCPGSELSDMYVHQHSDYKYVSRRGT